MSAKNGGTVFPYTGTAGAYSGMSLRDYFAAQALQGMLAEDAGAYLFKDLAVAAYQAADAMLSARTHSTEDN